MQENFIHFLSEEPCLIDINGKNIASIDNCNNFEVDIISNCEKIFVTYTPISIKQNIPYTFVLNTKSKVTCENEYIEVIPFPNNNFDIIMKPFYYYQVTNSKILLSSMIGKFFVSITTDSTTKISIQDGNNIVFNLNTIKLKSARAEIKKDMMIIEGIVDDYTYYLLVIDTKTFEIIHNDTSNSIEKNNDEIISYKTLKDISNHAEVCNINYDKKSKDTYHVYENNTPKQPTNPLLVPMAFMESIKISDDSLAKNYLHDNHEHTLTQSFRNYFGPFSNVYLNRHLIKEDIINYTIKVNNNYKNYNFIMENNKIKDIEEIF